MRRYATQLFGSQDVFTAPRARTRVLQVVTSYAYHEKSNKKKNRLRTKVLPALVPGVRSLLGASSSSLYDVDVHFVLGYDMSEDDFEFVRGKLPPSVNVTFSRPNLMFEDNETGELREYNLLLTKYHRQVVKERLADYDFFICFEDDMAIGRRQVDNYLELSGQLEKLIERAPSGGGSYKDDTDSAISREQFERMVPGFMRAELVGAGGPKEGDEDGTLACCDGLSQNLLVWESRPGSFRLRQVEGLGKEGQPVGFLPVANQNFDMAVGAQRVTPHPPRIRSDGWSHQAGWMATSRQIKRFESLCSNYGFLPPFRGFNELKTNQEFWLGGFFMYNVRSGCALQRVVRMDAEGFHRSLVYHISNNKQDAKGPRERMLSAEGLRAEVVKRWKEGTVEEWEGTVA